MAGRRSALIVATDSYDDAALSRLASPAADAAALADVLGDPALGGFEVDVLRNGTSSLIAQRVEALLRDRRPDDVVLLHFSCHGVKDEAGELFLAATNTDPTLLVSTALEASLVNRLIRRSRASRIVLLLDCCYGGAFERGSVPRAAGDIDVGGSFSQGALGGGRGRAVLTASSAMEYAFEGAQLADGSAPQPSVFTAAMAEGIRTGAADRDQDGYVSLSELYDFVFEQVRRHTPNQTPCKWEFDLQGDLHIARNPHRRVVPAPLPDDLRAMLDSPVTAARLGAVAELAHLAGGRDLPAAAAACAALAELRQDDSRRVSVAAEEAVARLTLRLPADRIDLGRAAAGGPPLVVELPVEGSPLALASTVSTSGPPLQAALAAGVLRIVATTDEPGLLAGAVALSGPGADLRVEVTAEIVRAADDPAPLPAPWWRRRPGRRSAVVLVACLALVAAALTMLPEKEDTGGFGPVFLRKEVVVAGTQPFTDTAIEVKAGQQLEISATGQVVHDGVNATGPDGFTNRPDLLTPLASANHNALIARIGTQAAPVLVGSSLTVTATAGGPLQLGINDGGLENNRGAYTAVVAVRDPV